MEIGRLGNESPNRRTRSREFVGMLFFSEVGILHVILRMLRTEVN